MKNTNSTSAAQGKGQSKEESNNSLIQPSQLKKLFENQLKDIYWAEKALTRAIPKMIKNATSKVLIKALTLHLEETNTQTERLIKVFTSIDKIPVAKKCDAMEGLIKESEEIMESCDEGAMCDAGIISAAQKVEHYEIATYGTLRQFAETLGFAEAVTLLETTLEEEKATDIKLSEIAQTINVEAAEEEVN